MSEFPREIYQKEIVVGEFDTGNGNYKAKQLLKELYTGGLKVQPNVKSTYLLLSNTIIFIHFYLKDGSGKVTSLLNLYKGGTEMYSLKELRNILYHLSGQKQQKIRILLSEVDFVFHLIDKYDMNLIQLALRFEQKETI